MEWYEKPSRLAGLLRSIVHSDVGSVDKKDTLNANTEPDYSRIATKLIIS